MEDLTLALVTLTSFVLLFVVAIFADRAGADLDVRTPEPVAIPEAVLDGPRMAVAPVPVDPPSADVA